jgi:hypothetical protein
MLNLETVTHDIESWIENFVEVPHPALGGWAPCPYARQARLNNEFYIRLGTSPMLDLIMFAQAGLCDNKVIVLVYDANHWSYEEFHAILEQANTDFLLERDLIVLEDHPASVEQVNGVTMNQGTYALALIQQRSDLEEKAQLLAKKDYYHAWPEDYLQQLFQHRKDPRL